MSGRDSIDSITHDISGGKRPHIMVDVLDGQNRWKPVRMLFDTGNDVTLINEKVAQELGLTDPETVGRAVPFKVQGIAGTPQDFIMIKRAIRLGGKTDPIEVKMGIGPVRENLLGREDVFEKFTASFSKNELKLTELRDNTVKWSPTGTGRTKTQAYVPKEKSFDDPDGGGVPFTGWR